MVEPIRSTNTAYVPENAPSSEGLTAEGLLAYCTSRLTSIDTLIQSRFNDQKRRNEALKSAGALMDILNRNTNGQAAGAKGYEGHHQQQGADLEKLWNATSDAQLRANIEDKYQVITGSPMTIDRTTGRATEHEPKDVPLNPDKIPGFDAQQWALKISDVKQFQEMGSKDNEQNMIELQSFVSQRQLAVQLTTQVMATLNESSKGIVANIRG